jgi:hypothetical protein
VTVAPLSGKLGFHFMISMGNYLHGFLHSDRYAGLIAMRISPSQKKFASALLGATLRGFELFHGAQPAKNAHFIS